MSKAGVLVLLLVVSIAGVVAGIWQTEYQGWSLAKEREHVKRREDPSSWNQELFNGDKESMGQFPSHPLTFGVFPYPKYDLIGTRSFRGLGSMRNTFPWGERAVVGTTFYNKRSPVNEKYIGKRNDEVFFQILVLTDEPVKQDGSNASSQIVSRNHPHVIGQGQLKTSKATIDYIAFQTAERNAYAVVNMRLFDLRAGRTIVIAPQKDGTLRSMQVEGPMLESSEAEAYQAKLLKEPKIKQFLDMPGNL